MNKFYFTNLVINTHDYVKFTEKKGLIIKDEIK